MIMVIIKTPDCDSQYTEASHKERGKDSQEQKKVRVPYRTKRLIW